MAKRIVLSISGVIVGLVLGYGLMFLSVWAAATLTGGSTVNIFVLLFVSVLVGLVGAIIIYFSTRKLSPDAAVFGLATGVATFIVVPMFSMTIGYMVSQWQYI